MLCELGKLQEPRTEAEEGRMRGSRKDSMGSLQQGLTTSPSKLKRLGVMLRH